MISILIVSDVRLYREALVERLAQRDGLTVVGTAVRPQDARAQAAELTPNVVVVDHALPESLGTARLIAALGPQIRVVVLGVSDSEDDVLAYAEAGVAGYVPRDASLDDLVAAIESAARGELLCSPRVAGVLLRWVARWSRTGVEPPARSALTSREAEIVRLIEQGLSNKEIATRLGIEVATVKNHVHNLLEKLRVHHRMEAAARLRGRDPRHPTPRGYQAIKD